MRPGLKRLIVILVVIAVVIGLLALLYKVFVTDAIMDRGGMERPREDYETVEETGE